MGGQAVRLDVLFRQPQEADPQEVVVRLAARSLSDAGTSTLGRQRSPFHLAPTGVMHHVFGCLMAAVEHLLCWSSAAYTMVGLRRSKRSSLGKVCQT